MASNFVDRSKVRGKMAEMGYTQEKLSEVLGISRATLNSRLQDSSSFTESEIKSLSEIFGYGIFILRR